MTEAARPAHQPPSTPDAIEFDSVLIANRGEIARRIIRSCRDLGLSTVAVYADPDAEAPHVAEADRSVRLPGSELARTYLDAELIVAAALRAGAAAVHPGYGFLAESAGFARAVQAAGLVWIGPPPRAIELMGSKVEAKRLMAEAGVPVLEDPSTRTGEPLSERDLPLLIKASAGGGGRGMRIVTELAELAPQLAAAGAEAMAAFGDGTVFCEPYLAAGRHLEVQLLADRHGTVWTLGERECSLQRRHQKVLEESPSPLAERLPGLRERLLDAAVAASRAVGYCSAGTVEFLADETGRFFFLEMNTRLQVEHPVTEARTGLDLVAEQLRIAAGARLAGPAPTPRGHSIEVRLYAEDPARDWAPQTGTVHRLAIPGVRAEFAIPGGGLRLDSGVRDGSVVSTRYDPMLAKVISTAGNRAEAARSLAGALSRAQLHGVRTNRDLVVRVLGHPAFLAGDYDTGFLQRELAALSRPLADDRAERLSAVVAALAVAAANRAGAAVLAGLPGGWRNVVSQPQRRRLAGPGGEHEISYHYGESGWVIEGFDDLQVLSVSPELVRLQVGGLDHRFEIARYGEELWVDSDLGSVALRRLPRFSDPADALPAGSLLATLPGSVLRLAVAPGDAVHRGQPLLWLEAMKMEHQVLAPADGVVGELPVRVGDQVAVGDLLVVLAEPEPPA